MSDDCLNIGTALSDVFVLKVQLNGVSDFHHLWTPPSSSPSSSSSVWLSYCFVEPVIVQTDRFSPAAPVFAPVHDMFRLRSSVVELAAFFSSTSVHSRGPPLSVYLCRDGQVVAEAVIPLAALLRVNGDPNQPVVADADFAEATATGGFALRPLTADGDPDMSAPTALLHGSVELLRETRPMGGTVQHHPTPAVAPQSVPPAMYASGRSDHMSVSGGGWSVPPMQPMMFGVGVPIVPSQTPTTATPAPTPTPTPAESKAAEETEANVKRRAEEVAAATASAAAAAEAAEAAAGAAERAATDLEEARALRAAAEEEVRQAKTAANEELDAIRRELAKAERQAEAAQSRAQAAQAEAESRLADQMARAEAAERARQAEVRRIEEVQRVAMEEARNAKDAARAAHAAKSAADDEEVSKKAAAASSAAAEYQKLSIRLRRTLAEAERRDHALRVAQQEAEMTLTAKLGELELHKAHLQKEAEHLVLVEKRKTAAVGAELRDTRVELEAAKERARRLEQEVMSMRDKMLAGPSAELKHRVAVVEAEKADLLRAADEHREAMTESERAKERLRAQLVRLARELSRMRQDERERHAREVEKLRVEYLTREGRYVLDGERATLRDIRQQLEQCEGRVTAVIGGGGSGSGSGSGGGGGGSGHPPSSAPAPPPPPSSGPPAVSAQ